MAITAKEQGGTRVELPPLAHMPNIPDSQSARKIRSAIETMITQAYYEAGNNPGALAHREIYLKASPKGNFLMTSDVDLALYMIKVSAIKEGTWTTFNVRLHDHGLSVLGLDTSSSIWTSRDITKPRGDWLPTYRRLVGWYPKSRMQTYKFNLPEAVNKAIGELTQERQALGLT